MVHFIGIPLLLPQFGHFSRSSPNVLLINVSATQKGAATMLPIANPIMALAPLAADAAATTGATTAAPVFQALARLRFM
jgi:hypothetical protein